MKKLLLLTAVLFCSILITNKPVYAQADLYLDGINVYISEYGKIQIYSLPDTTMQIVRTSALVGTAPGVVFDIREDLDIEQALVINENPPFGDIEVSGIFNNNYSGLPPNVIMKQSIYCWQNSNAIIAKYTVTNSEPDPINAVMGFELIPEVEGEYAGGDTVVYDPQTKIISDRKHNAVGFKLLSGDINSLNIFTYYPDYNTDSTFWDSMTNGEIDDYFITDPNDPLVDDPVIIPSFAPKTIAKMQSATYYLALGWGENHAALLASMEEAQQRYNQLTSVESDYNNIPTEFTLDQNYPNPFNPSTKISFGLPQRSEVTLKVYNTLGEMIAELATGTHEAGTYTYSFDGSKLNSGIYIYSLQTNSGLITKKMTLIK